MGASAETSAALGSRGLPPHPGGARAADSARPPRADESGEGAGGGGCGRAEVGGGGGLGAGGAPLAVPAAGRRAAGRSHRAHGVRALLPSVVTGRGAPGSGQGLAAAQDKRLTEAERRKVFSSAQIPTEEIPAEPHDPVAGRGVWGRRVGCPAGFQERGHAIATWVPASLPLPTTGRNSPGPAAPTLAASLLFEDADKIQPPPPDSQPPGGVPRPQSCTCSAGIIADKNLSLGTKYPLSGVLLPAGSPDGGKGHTHQPGAPLTGTPGFGARVPPAPGPVGKPRLIPGFPGADAGGLSLHAPQTLSYLTLPGLVGVPLAGCAGAARAEPDPASTINTALERPPDLAPKKRSTRIARSWSWAGQTRANRIFESFGEQCLGSTLNVTAKEEYGLILVTLKHPVSGDCPLFTEKKVI